MLIQFFICLNESFVENHAIFLLKGWELQGQLGNLSVDKAKEPKHIL